MTIAAPVILLPTAGVDYATDTAVQTLSGTTVSGTRDILVNNSSYGVTFTPGEMVWAWTGTLTLGLNKISVVALDNTNSPSSAAALNITLVQSSSFITVTAPTGVRVRSYQDKLEIVNQANTETQTIGYNYYVASMSGGPYTKINSSIIDNYSFFEEKSSLISQDISTAGNIRVTTNTEEIINVYYYSVFFDKSSPGAPATLTEDQVFFFVATAVIYDPVAGQVTESAYSIELQGSPIIITTGVKPLPSRSQNDIILTFSQELLTGNKNISTLPGTVVRDMLNPVSEEMARVYVIQDFLARALSVSALQDFDDANGDAISDPVGTSTPKQALKISLGRLLMLHSPK